MTPKWWQLHSTRASDTSEPERQRRLWPVPTLLFAGVLIGSLLLAGCSGESAETTGFEPAEQPTSHPATRVVKDERPTFRIDPGKPWRIEFGRGSGWHGLDTVKLDQDGRLVLHREKSGLWETATLELPADAVAKVLEAVEANRLLELDKAYHAAVADGTQWVLWVRQGERQKSAYFDNHFPEPIVRFASRLDAILSATAGSNLRWRAVPSAESGQHARELWDSIKP